MKSVACLLLVLLCLPASARAATVNQTGYWAFDEGAGAAAADSAGGHTATLTGGAAWGLGAKGYAMTLNGTSAYADVGAPVIDTANSFTVSVRVKLNRLDGFRTMVSVDGTRVSTFYLQYREADGHRFGFARHDGDPPASPARYAVSSTVAEIGRWYMITGVYDAAASTLALYVDNRFESVVVAPPA
jgi:hypothetical protein